MQTSYVCYMVNHYYNNINNIVKPNRNYVKIDIINNEFSLCLFRLKTTLTCRNMWINVIICIL